MQQKSVKIRSYRNTRMFSISPLLKCNEKGVVVPDPTPGFYTTGELSDAANTLDAVLPPDTEICIAESREMPMWAQQKYDELENLLTSQKINGVVIYRSMSESKAVSMATFTVFWAKEEIDPISRKPKNGVMPEILHETYYETIGKNYYSEGDRRYDVQMDFIEDHQF